MSCNCKNELLPVTVIAKMPTEIDKIHESLYRCWSVLQNVKMMLREDTAPNVILSHIRDIEEVTHILRGKDEENKTGEGS